MNPKELSSETSEELLGAVMEILETSVKFLADSLLTIIEETMVSMKKNEPWKENPSLKPLESITNHNDAIMEYITNHRDEVTKYMIGNLFKIDY